MVFWKMLTRNLALTWIQLLKFYPLFGENFLEEIRLNAFIEEAVIQLPPPMTLVRKANIVCADTILAKRANHHFRLRHIDPRVHDTVAVKDRNADIIRFRDRRNLLIEGLPLWIRNIAIFDQV